DIKVILRGLSINAVGGANGVNVSDFATVVIQNCVISNFTTGVRATLPADVRILDSTFLSNQYGVYGSGGAIVNVSRSAFSGSQYAVYASGDVNATYTKVTISDTIAAGNIYGFTAESLTGTTGNVSMAVTRSTASNGNYGIYVHRVGGNNVWA